LRGRRRSFRSWSTAWILILTLVRVSGTSICNNGRLKSTSCGKASRPLSTPMPPQSASTVNTAPLSNSTTAISTSGSGKMTRNPVAAQKSQLTAAASAKATTQMVCGWASDARSPRAAQLRNGQPMVKSLRLTTSAVRNTTAAGLIPKLSHQYLIRRTDS